MKSNLCEIKAFNSDLTWNQNEMRQDLDEMKWNETRSWQNEMKSKFWCVSASMLLKSIINVVDML